MELPEFWFFHTFHAYVADDTGSKKHAPLAMGNDAGCLLIYIPGI
jgi:hypothetical protein